MDYSPERKLKAVYTIVEDGRSNRPIFRRIGNAFVNSDQSLNVYLDALPVSGRLHIRELDVRRLPTNQAQRGAA